MARGVGAGGGPDERVPARRVDGGGAAGGARRSPLPRAEKLVALLSMPNAAPSSSSSSQFWRRTWRGAGAGGAARGVTTAARRAWRAVGASTSTGSGAARTLEAGISFEESSSSHAIS
jgi:hypothetical protein